MVLYLCRLTGKTYALRRRYCGFESRQGYTQAPELRDPSRVPVPQHGVVDRIILDRLMVGCLTLNQVIVVRVHVREQRAQYTRVVVMAT